MKPLREPEVVNFGWREWGNRAGIWYLLDALAEHGLPAAALMNTAIIGLCPQIHARPLNDVPALHAAKWSPGEWADATLGGFEKMLRLSARHPIVFNLSLHPFLVGWPARLRHLRRIFARLAASAAAGEVWLCTPGAIAAHARLILCAQGKRA